MDIQELSGPWSFVKQSWKTFWKNKSWYFSFAALPMLLSIVPNFYAFDSSVANLAQFPNTMASLIDRYLSPVQLFSFACIFFITPLFCIAWNQYLLNPDYKPGLRSYLTFDKKYFKYILYHIVIMLLFAVCAVILGIAILFIAKTIMSFMVAIQAMPILTSILSLFIAAILILGMFYFLLPLSLILPAVSIGKNLTLLKIIKEGKAYRKNFFLSFLLFLLVGGGLYLILSFIVGIVFGLITFYVPGAPSLSLLIAAFSAIGSYVFMGPMLTLYALYYKKQLMN